MRTRTRIVLAIAAAVSLVGCPEPGDAPAPLACAGADAGALACVSVRVRTPTTELVHGPQGGWHIDVAAAFAGIDPSGLTLEYTARRADDEALLGAVEYRITPRLLTMEGDAFVHDDDLLVLEILAPGEIVGADLDVSARLLREGLELARDQVRVRVVDEIEEPVGR